MPNIMEVKSGMHSVNGLYKAMLQHDEVVKSIEEAAKRKKGRRLVRKVRADVDKYADAIIETVLSGKWHPRKHKEMILFEGMHKKKRNIYKPDWYDEQILHHMLIRQLRPLIIARSYRYACGVISKKDEKLMKVGFDESKLTPEIRASGRGSVFAVQVMNRWV